MHSEQVARIRCVLIQSITDSTIDRGRIGELGKGWKDNALFFESLDTVLERRFINHMVSKTELSGECFGVERFGKRGHALHYVKQSAPPRE